MGIFGLFSSSCSYVFFLRLCCLFTADFYPTFTLFLPGPKIIFATVGGINGGIVVPCVLALDATFPRLAARASAVETTREEIPPKIAQERASEQHLVLIFCYWGALTQRRQELSTSTNQWHIIQPDFSFPPFFPARVWLLGDLYKHSPRRVNTAHPCQAKVCVMFFFFLFKRLSAGRLLFPLTRFTSSPQKGRGTDGKCCAAKRTGNRI